MTILLSVFRPDTGKAWDQYTAAYTVHGVSVGHTSLRAITYLPDSRTVASHAKPVEVRLLMIQNCFNNSWECQWHRFQKIHLYNKKIGTKSKLVFS